MVVSALLAARALTPDHEVIVVNDGSKDNTPHILDELARMYPQVRIVHHQKNRGYGGALRSGFAAATKDFVFYTDGDAQYDPSEVALLWERMGPDVDLVNGYKISRSDPFHRIVIGRMYFDTVTLTKDSGVICLEMMKKITDAGFRIAEVPVHHFHRAYGKSQFFNFRRIFRTGLDVLRLWHDLVIKKAHQAGPQAQA
jgi:glycosyltransferase involved in cell wall biosynthesis